jgi:hypothetical protein
MYIPGESKFPSEKRHRISRNQAAEQMQLGWELRHTPIEVNTKNPVAALST